MRIQRLFIAVTLGLGLVLTLAFFPSLIWATPPVRPFWVPDNPVTDPVSNTHNAPATATISISYDETISPATISTRTFAIHAMQTGQLTQTYSVSGNSISLKPSQPLKPGELVQVSATTGTLDLVNGTGPLSPTVWQFWATATGGSGGFSKTQSLGNFWSTDVALGDLDRDGDLDAFVGNTAPLAGPPSPIQAQVLDNYVDIVWSNDGTGTFITQSLGSSVTTTWAVALGDVDGDSDLDAFIGNAHFSKANEVWLNDGTGVFTDSNQNLGSATTLAVDLGDVDGDSDLDAFVGNNGANEVWLNNGTGIFSDSGQTLGNAYTVDVSLGDLDGDGDLDAFIGNFSVQANEVWFNNGSGTFTDSTQRLGSSTTWAVALGDINEDGDLDALIANTGANEVWLNNGTGIFSDSGQRLDNSYSYAVALGDLDGDSDLDAFVGNSGANEVWLNDGTGTFSDSDQRLGNSDSYAVALGDLDGDGDLDTFVGNFFDQANEVWLNGSQLPQLTTKVYLPLILKNN
jgi:predicted nucleotidyltransferase